MEVIKKKVVVIGSGGCGKTSLLRMFCKDEFTEISPVTTVVNAYISNTVVEGRQVQLSLVDTPGDEAYDQFRLPSYQNSDTILMCFSIDHPSTLANITCRWMPEIQEYCPNVPIVLVGTKKDLRTDVYTLDRLVKIEQLPPTICDGIRMARKIRAYTYLECSAKLNEGVKEAFEATTCATLHTEKENIKCCTMQ